jgi:hypothetical protein
LNKHETLCPRHGRRRPAAEYQGKTLRQIKMLASIIKFVAILFLISANGCASQSPASQNNCKILIERSENNGFINIVPCTIKCSSGHKAVLRGGENDLFIVEPGKYSLTATSANPYPAAAKDSDWESGPVEVTVANSQVMKIVVEPKSENSVYVGGWEFQQQP